VERKRRKRRQKGERERKGGQAGGFLANVWQWKRSSKGAKQGAQSQPFALGPHVGLSSRSAVEFRLHIFGQFSSIFEEKPEKNGKFGAAEKPQECTRKSCLFQAFFQAFFSAFFLAILHASDQRQSSERQSQKGSVAESRVEVAHAQDAPPDNEQDFGQPKIANKK